MKRILRYLKGTPTLGQYYPKCSGFDLKGYSDSDYAGCNMDRKSTLGACQILCGKLVCWSAKKQQSEAMSSAEAEYIAAARCCASILWMKSQLSDYDIHYKMVPIFYDNTSAIASFMTTLVPLQYPTIQYFIQESSILILDIISSGITSLKEILNYTSSSLMVYQNFLKEFWSTSVAFDPFSSTDEPEKCPLKEFLIKFSILNGQRPLTLDFHTFCSSTGLNYNNGKYVDHPTPEVLGGNYSSTEQRDSVSPPPLVAKPIKGKSQTVASTLPKSQGPKASGALTKKSKRPKSKKPPTETMVTSPKPTEGSKQSH
ncbi:hypothetical protein Tco_1276292 [Tanacetum coccineum]